MPHRCAAARVAFSLLPLRRAASFDVQQGVKVVTNFWPLPHSSDRRGEWILLHSNSQRERELKGEFGLL